MGWIGVGMEYNAVVISGDKVLDCWCQTGGIGVGTTGTASIPDTSSPAYILIPGTAGEDFIMRYCSSSTWHIYFLTQIDE